jgi:dephospho-CoA kinase
MTRKDLQIGLTGSIGTGKSRVAELFRANGAQVVDADEAGRFLLEPGKKGWRALKSVFGNRFFKDDLTVDRQKFRSAIFADPTLREEVDSLLHPLIREEICHICQWKAESGRRLTVVEIPLLYETGWQGDFDLVVVVAADDETCLSRIMARDGVSRPEAEQALAAQMSIKEKVALADHVIDNNGAWSDTVTQFDELISKLVFHQK